MYKKGCVTQTWQKINQPITQRFFSKGLTLFRKGPSVSLNDSFYANLSADNTVSLQDWDDNLLFWLKSISTHSTDTLSSIVVFKR